MRGKDYTYIIDKKYRWNAWAKPKTKDGKPDYNKEMIGDDLIKFVNNELFPYLAKFKKEAEENPQTNQYKIGEIYSELDNKVKSGYNLRGNRPGGRVAVSFAERQALAEPPVRDED